MTALGVIDRKFAKQKFRLLPFANGKKLQILRRKMTIFLVPNSPKTADQRICKRIIKKD